MKELSEVWPHTAMRTCVTKQSKKPAHCIMLLGETAYDGIWNKEISLWCFFKQGVFNQTDVIISGPSYPQPYVLVPAIHTSRSGRVHKCAFSLSVTHLLKCLLHWGQCRCKTVGSIETFLRLKFKYVLKDWSNITWS